MLYATCLRILLHFYELLSDLPLSSINVYFTKVYALKKEMVSWGLTFSLLILVPHDCFHITILKMSSAKYLFPKQINKRDRTGSSTWQLLMCCYKLSRLIMMSLRWPSDTTAAQIGHCTKNGFRRKSADPYTFLTFALLSKNFLSSQAVKRNVRQLAAWTIRWTILR